MTLLPLLYTLDESCPVPWSISAEVQLHSDYPFVDIKEETEQEFVIRRYLETLWLPEVRFFGVHTKTEVVITMKY